MTDIIDETMVEIVKQCPVCGGDGRESIDNVYDWMFETFETIWRYSECNQCGSLYLFRRLREEYISLAYRGYYTHNDLNFENYSGKFLIKKIVKYFSKPKNNKNINKKIKYFLCHNFPPLKNFLSAKSRNIGELKPGTALDFGCGNGDFMKLAQDIGWNVKGYDLDSDAIVSAKKYGLNADFGGIEHLVNEKNESYDLITLSHVIEHVYDAEFLLSECMRILKPYGVLWMETPNSKSFGRTIYGKYWRGLEPPRHIVLFNHSSLELLLTKAGFNVTTRHDHTLSSLYMCIESEKNKAIAKKTIKPGGRLPFISYVKCLFYGAVIEVVQATIQRRSEFLTIISVKRR